MWLSRRLLTVFGLFCCSLLLFIFGLDTQEVIGFDSRFYLFALEMWRHGWTWFPTVYRQPYPDYPVTPIFIIYGVAKGWGSMSKVIAILPTASMAALTVVWTYLIGALHHRYWGYYAVCFLLLTVTFIGSARALTLDFYPTMATAGCFYLVHSAALKGERPSRWLYLLLCFSFACRGPIGLVLPAGVICLYEVLARQYRQCVIFSFLAGLLLMMGSGVLLGIAYRAGGTHFVHEVLHMQVISRLADKNDLPVYFYMVAGLGDYALSFPCALLVLIGTGYYRWLAKQTLPEAAFLQKLFGWMSIILIGMSIPVEKKMRYILPITPALALLAAYPFVAGRYFVYLRAIGVRFFLCLPFFMLIFLGVVAWFIPSYLEGLSLPYTSLISGFVGIQGMSALLFFLYRQRSEQRNQWLMAIAALTFIYGYLAIIEPIQLYVNQTRVFVNTIERQRLQERARLVFYKEQPDGLPIKYLVNMQREERPVFIDTVQALMRFSMPAFFVTSAEYYADLPQTVVKWFYVVAQGKIGHVAVVVLKKRVDQSA